MRSSNSVIGSKITTRHQAKFAFVYIRQSSLVQVIHNKESTELQYRLAKRAIQLGWPKERVKVIDEDLGKSARTATDRSGFQHLIAEVSLGRSGLVLSLDASRLARNNSDWYQLLELCSIFGTLIADSDSVFDPRLYPDRMMLGLSGMMSEAELYQLKRRLQAGAWNKAERGELPLPLPVGLFRGTDALVIFNPDEEVQERIRLVFRKFKELGTARAVTRYLQREGLLLPTRPLKGPAPHEIIWQTPRNSMVLGILKNPAYAGAYVYGRIQRDPTRCKPGRPQTGLIRLPIDKWPILIYNIYPAYISWEDFLSNQEQLRTNQNRYQEGHRGVVRKGQALLQGIVVCGKCSARMYLHYSGSQSEFPVYKCSYVKSELNGPCCQEVRGLGLDAEIERLVLAALAPDRVALALAALEQLENEYAALGQQWQLRLERARYEAERARRQYYAVEPENRLVARTLEQQWEEKLRALEKIEQEYQSWQQENRLELTSADRQDILALGENLPKLWHAPTTTATDRKRIVRLVIKEVIVEQDRELGKVWLQINWQTGAVSEHSYKRRVHRYADHADLETIEKRIRELQAKQKMDKQIAEILNAEGFRTARGQFFTVKNLWLLRKQLNLSATKPNGSHPLRWQDGTFSVEGAAVVIGVFPGTIYKWLRRNQLKGVQIAKGLPWKIYLNEEEIAYWKEHIKRVRRSRKEVL